MLRTMKSLNYILPLLLTLISLNAYAKKKIRKPAEQGFEYESVILNYAPNSSKLKKFKVHFGPFSKYISFIVPSAPNLADGSGGFKTVVMDCASTKLNTQWTCSGGCESGTRLNLLFNDGVKLDKVTLKKFKGLIPRACDGTEGRKNKTVSQKSDIIFHLQKVSIER